MSYIDEQLVSGERVEYRTSLHWATLIVPIVLVVFSIYLFQVEITAAVVLLLLGSIWFGARLGARSTSEFGVTNKRVVMKLGVLGRRTAETLLTKVEGVTLDQGIGGRLLGYGSVVVTGTGGSKERFHRISNPTEFRQKVQEQIESRAAGDAARMTPSPA